MAQIHATAERHIDAPAALVYAYIADHRTHHQNFLPPAFSDYKVEEGGIGAGTVVSYRLKAGGRTHTARARIEEPEPGRVITEILDSGYVTTITVEPEDAGSRVRIDTRGRKGGILGVVESLMAPRLLEPIFVDELQRLNSYATSQAVSI